MDLSCSNIKKCLIFQETETLKKFLIFSRKEAFLMFSQKATVLIFQETEAPKKFLYFLKRKLFLYFRKWNHTPPPLAPSKIY